MLNRRGPLHWVSYVAERQLRSIGSERSEERPAAVLSRFADIAYDDVEGWNCASRIGTTRALPKKRHWSSCQQYQRL
jgi:hypothetical protein